MFTFLLNLRGLLGLCNCLWRILSRNICEMLRKVFPAYQPLIWGLGVSLYLFCLKEALQISNYKAPGHVSILLRTCCWNSGESAPPCGRRCERRLVLCFQSARRHWWSERTEAPGGPVEDTRESVRPQCSRSVRRFWGLNYFLPCVFFVSSFTNLVILKTIIINQWGIISWVLSFFSSVISFIAYWVIHSVASV